MKTFLDTNITKTKSFILYGNLKDTIWCPDLMPRDLEHYLVKVLKSRGFKHVIFYGEAGTKGAYCLDEQSARFFFSANSKFPLPLPLSEDFEFSGEDAFSESAPAAQNDRTNTTGSQVSDALDDLFGSSDDEYAPGNFDAVQSNEESTEQRAQAAPQTFRIRYSYRGQTMSEFLQRIHPLMLDKKSQMAVVFYNVLTTDIKSSDLRDDILDIWEKNSRGNICLMLVPETMTNQTALETKVRQYGLESKFMQQISNSSIPNEINCIRIGQPNVDELRYMLRYLSFVGTEKGNKIKFPYSSLENLARRIQYASGKRTGISDLPKDLACEYMSEIHKRLSDYIDSKATFGTLLQITAEDIDRAWDIESDEGKALLELKKPGWEPAYEKITQVLQTATKAQKRSQKALEKTAISKRSSADWAVSRIETAGSDNNSERQPIPNFILLGNPGTGKTTIAKLIGNILHEAGLLKIGQTVITTKEGLTSSYVAGVPKATMAKVNEAEEGVLLIDEAHLLGKKDGGAEHDGTGVEVISTLNAVMTNQNHHLSIILAGYEDEMEAVFDLDPGFRSRFGNNIIKLEDYPPELLTSILLQTLIQKGYSLSEDLTKSKNIADTSYVPIECMVERFYSERDRKRFGNARDIITLASHAEGNVEGDTVTQECFYGGCDENITEEWFEPTDVGASQEFIQEELNRKFVGMDSVKEVMKDIGLELEDYAARGISPEEIELRPIILVGNPGVGKTSLANLLPKLYFHYRLLGTSKPITVNASSLADSHQGGTQEKVLGYIKKAQDCKGFLFVDEAHEFLNPHFDGRGAFKAFMAPTTDREHPFLACFAVYTDKLEEFLNIDPGAERRFRIIKFDDYTGEELFAIMQKMIKEKSYASTEETDELLRKALNQIYLTRTPKTGNAGKVKRILEEMDILRRQRCAKSGIPFDSDESLIFRPEDIPENLRKNLSADKEKSSVERLLNIKEKFKKERIGADGLKDVLSTKADALIYKEKFPRRAKIIEPGHYFFKGSPGTGKTTGATFLANYMYELGIIQNPDPIFISASSLVGQYLGETGIKTRERLVNSAGKVLVIDEAYALAVTGHGASEYKKDAVNEIVNFLDNETYRKNTCVIFAGYEHDMNELYKSNSGLKSRVTEINFPDFTVEQSAAVLKSMLKSEQISLSEEVEQLCKEQIEQMHKSPEFANGRTIRKYSEILCNMLEQRCIRNAAEYIDDDPRAYELMTEDIPEIQIVFSKLNLLSFD